MEGERLLLVITVIAVLFSLGSVGLTYLTFADFSSTISGFATGEANVSVESVAAVNFSNSSIDWGSGRIDAGKTKAYLDTQSGTVTDGNWTAQGPGGLILENVGNNNLTVNLTTDNAASVFIGGTSPAYQWNISNHEAGSCLQSNLSDPESLGFFRDVNNSQTELCSRFRFESGNDEIEIHINITIPEDAETGARGSIITATVFAE